MIGSDFPRVLEQAKGGDREAIAAIYRDTAPMVIGYLRASGAVEPEDVASDVFISVIGALWSFEGDETHFRSWILTITHRRMIDAIRRTWRRREHPTPVDELGERMLVLGDSESEAMSRLRSRGVLDALDELTEDQRSVLMLRVLADLTITDIAAILDKSETAVKALLRRGMSSLARLIAREELTENNKREGADSDGE